jgi:predicted RNA-binding Zn-ribbon protein involved in translation (DUF1610 family)
MDRQVLKTALAPGEGCLSTEQIGAFADGALARDEQASAVAHLRTCPSCQAELALLHAVTSTVPRPGEEEIVREGLARLEGHAAPIAGTASGAARPWLGFSPRHLAAAAAVVLAVAGAVYLGRERAPQLPGRVSEQDVTRSLAVAVRSPVGDQREAPRRFEWEAVAGAVRYRVRLMEVDRREVWSASASAPALDLPPALRGPLSVPRALLWEVTAYDAAGRALAESGPQSFRVVLR